MLAAARRIDRRWALVITLSTLVSFGRASTAPVVCDERSILLTELEGDISGHGGGGPCRWTINVLEPHRGVEFSSLSAYFSGPDVLAIHVPALSRNLEKEFGYGDEIPPRVTIATEDTVSVTLLAISLDTVFDVHYKILLKDYVNFLGTYYPKDLFLGVLTCAVLAASLLVFLTIWWLWAMERQRIAIRASLLRAYSRRASSRQQQEPMNPPTTSIGNVIEAAAIRQLRALPTTGYQGSEEKFDEECSLCLDTFEEGVMVRELRCSHIFHQECIDKWFKSQRFRARTCPLCRDRALGPKPASLSSTSLPSNTPAILAQAPSPVSPSTQPVPRRTQAARPDANSSVAVSSVPSGDRQLSSYGRSMTGLDGPNLTFEQRPGQRAHPSCV